MTPAAGGCYIAFEGGDGCGKSTQASLLADALGAVLTREPGGTVIGRSIRQLLLDPANHHLDDRAEALLYAADRAQHSAEVVLPALASGRHVVSDRSAYSSIAYQAYGRGLPLDDVRRFSHVAIRGRWPDLVVLLTVSDAIATARLGGDLDRLEQVSDDFRRRVADGFDALAATEPDRFVRIDASASVDEVASVVRGAVAERLGL